MQGHVSAIAPLEPSWPRTIAALVIRETTARFGRSWGGYLWALAEPLGGIVLLTLVVGLIARMPPLGSSFMLFYATGILPFLAYNSVAAAAMNALPQNRGLLRYPSVSALDVILARAILETLTYSAVTALILTPIVISQRQPVGIDLGPVALSLGLSAMLGLGVGLFNAVVAGFFPSWRAIWSMLNRPLFLVSGVLFTIESVPTDLRYGLLFNPVAHVIVTMRKGVFGTAAGEFASPVYVAGLALALFVSGAFLLWRNEARLAQG